MQISPSLGLLWFSRSVQLSFFALQTIFKAPQGLAGILYACAVQHVPHLSVVNNKENKSHRLQLVEEHAVPKYCFDNFFAQTLAVERGTK